jgi:cytochrome c oxidase subunit IV
LLVLIALMSFEADFTNMTRDVYLDQGSGILMMEEGTIH